MWHEIKMLPLVQLGLSPAQLHVLAGLALFALCLAVTRRPLLALGLVALAQFGNEVADLWDDAVAERAVDGAEILSDTVATLFLPVMAALAIRWLRR